MSNIVISHHATNAKSYARTRNRNTGGVVVRVSAGGTGGRRFESGPGRVRPLTLQ